MFEIIIAFVIDLVIGDPGYKFHPVRVIGYAVVIFEMPFRKISNKQRLNGLFFTIFIIGISIGCVFLLLFIASFIDDYFKIDVIKRVVSIFLIYSSISVKDLRDKAIEIYNLLYRKDIDSARMKLAMIVGRDTINLSEKEIIRATIETVSENIVDGIISPLFYAFIGGSALAITYKAINTLDSMVGYKNDRYIDFGCTAARFDDISNYLPARICGVIISIASFLLHKNGMQSIQTLLRDGNKNPSPNSGIPEAAVAGALGVQLGGVNYYHGEKTVKPFIGNKMHELALKHIKESIVLEYITSISFLLASLCFGFLLHLLFRNFL